MHKFVQEQMRSRVTSQGKLDRILRLHEEMARELFEETDADNSGAASLDLLSLCVSLSLSLCLSLSLSLSLALSCHVLLSARFDPQSAIGRLVRVGANAVSLSLSVSLSLTLSLSLSLCGVRMPCLAQGFWTRRRFCGCRKYWGRSYQLLS